jgi:hypothetical protein
MNVSANKNFSLSSDRVGEKMHVGSIKSKDEQFKALNRHYFTLFEITIQSR